MNEMLTIRPLSTGIISATHLLQKKGWRRRVSNPRPTGWEAKNIQAPARVRTQDLQPD